MPLPKELMEILACPRCKGALELREARHELVCHVCRLRFEVRDGVPVMLLEEARPLGD